MTLQTSTSRQAIDNYPFQKAKSLDKRLKLFLWGDSGVGKTTLALQFPKPVVIDMEGGADLYGDMFVFEVLRTTTADWMLPSAWRRKSAFTKLMQELRWDDTSLASSQDFYRVNSTSVLLKQNSWTKVKRP